MKINFYSMYPDLLLNFVPEDIKNADGEVNIYSDLALINLYPYENAIAMLVEPRAIIPEAYAFVEDHHDEYKCIFTFDSKMLGYENAKLLLFGNIQCEYDKPKTKMISMVCSDKHFCQGHIQRMELAYSLKGLIDTYGTFDGGEFADYEDIWGDYKFNVAVENYSDGHYFTEKITNCFACKVVPIYWGCPNIATYFNPYGIIRVENLDSVKDIVDLILRHGDAIYYDMRYAIEDNYNRVQRFRHFGETFFEMYADYIKELAK